MLYLYTKNKVRKRGTAYGTWLMKARGKWEEPTGKVEVCGNMFVFEVAVSKESQGQRAEARVA